MTDTAASTELVSTRIPCGEPDCKNQAAYRASMSCCPEENELVCEEHAAQSKQWIAENPDQPVICKTTGQQGSLFSMLEWTTL